MDSLTKERLTLKDWVLGIFSYIVIYSILTVPLIEFNLVQSFLSQIVAISLSIVGAIKLVRLNKKFKISKNIYISGFVIYILILVYMTFKVTV